MKYEALTVAPLLALFLFLLYSGQKPSGAAILVMGGYAIVRTNRIVALLACLFSGGWVLSTTIQKDLHVIFSLSCLMFILAFWELFEVQRLSKKYPDASPSLNRKATLTLLCIGFLFLVTLLSYLSLSFFTVSIPLFLVVVIAFVFFASLYLFIEKD